MTTTTSQTNSKIISQDIFNEFFTNPTTRKQFKITKASLIKKYPDVFYIHSKNICYKPDTEQAAKEILSNYYIPFLIESGELVIHKNKSQYINKAGEIKTYITRSYYKPKAKNNNVEIDNLFNNNESYKKIANDKTIDLKQRTAIIFYDSNFPSNISYVRLSNYLKQKYM